MSEALFPQSKHRAETPVLLGRYNRNPAF